jgi:hypothetical protein
MAPKKKARKASTKRRASASESDSANEVLLLILGSGPAVAAFDGLLAAHGASGVMYHNAVANQQKTNILGMAMTAKAVRYLLDAPSTQSPIHEKRKR